MTAGKHTHGTWTYRQSEPSLWTVGHYDLSGKWYPESDHETPGKAGDRVIQLNGGTCCPCNSHAEREAVIVKLVGALEGMISVMDAIEQDEGIEACQCALRAVVRDRCNYCKAHAALALSKEQP